MNRADFFKALAGLGLAPKVLLAEQKAPELSPEPEPLATCATSTAEPCPTLAGKALSSGDTCELRGLHVVKWKGHELKAVASELSIHSSPTIGLAMEAIPAGGSGLVTMGRGSSWAEVKLWVPARQWKWDGSLGDIGQLEIWPTQNGPHYAMRACLVAVDTELGWPAGRAHKAQLTFRSSGELLRVS